MEALSDGSAALGLSVESDMFLKDSNKSMCLISALICEVDP
jgi:hypothetical protein